jgi:hypothetical protein
MCPILDGYRVTGIFYFPYTPSCEPRVMEQAGGWRTQLGGLSFALQALFFPSDPPTHHAEWLSNYYVFKNRITYSDCAGS